MNKYSVKVVGDIVAGRKPSIVRAFGPINAAKKVSSRRELESGEELEVLTTSFLRYRYRVARNPRMLEPLGRVL